MMFYHSDSVQSGFLTDAPLKVGELERDRATTWFEDHKALIGIIACCRRFSTERGLTSLWFRVYLSVPHMMVIVMATHWEVFFIRAEHRRLPLRVTVTIPTFL